MQLSKYMKAAIAATVLLATGAIYLGKMFLTFLVGWIIAIPIVVCGYLAYGLTQYRKQTKNSIVISVKPSSVTEKYVELIRKEEEIRKEKESLYKELTNGNKKGI
jgi:hypothetical protein